MRERIPCKYCNSVLKNYICQLLACNDCAFFFAQKYKTVDERLLCLQIVLSIKVARVVNIKWFRYGLILL